MELASKEQVICINVLIQKLKLSEFKTDMVLSFSENRSESSKGLSKNEARAMIQYLKSVDPEEASCVVMRRKILSMCHELGWYKTGTKVLDMKRIDQWCMTYGYLHKKLDSYLYQELPKLVTQFQEGPYKHFLSSF